MYVPSVLRRIGRKYREDKVEKEHQFALINRIVLEFRCKGRQLFLNYRQNGEQNRLVACISLPPFIKWEIHFLAVHHLF
jgi:hypothetical protein